MREDRNNGFNEGNTYLFSYDSRGNLTSNSTLRYVNPESSTDSIKKDYTTDFTLDNEIWADAITEINTASKFIYDENGNPLSFDSIHFDWSEGRMLKSVEYSEDGMSLIDCRFTYNEKGIRTSKTVFGKTTYFTTDDGIITSQYQLDDEGNVKEEMIFLYDSSDNLLGFTYGGETYFYIKNHMGDVMGIADSNGTWLVKYYYQNAWGDISTQTVNDSAGRDIEALHTLGDLNPMRYKGYYYDREISMYYLQSRYYFPGITAKFLNADLPEFAKVGKEQYSGTNLFAYCKNDPVNNSDPTGHWGIEIHYGKAKNTGKYGKIKYDGTYEWAMQCKFKSKYATKIAEGDWDIDANKNTTANPLRAFGADSGLSNRQKYHFDRSKKDSKDTRIFYGNKFFTTALNSYKDAVKNFESNDAKLRKKLSTSSKEYKNLHKNLVNNRDKRIGSACFVLGKALHCYQDVYAHGNIDAGYGRTAGHFFNKNFDNPYYAWKPGSNEQKIVEKKKLTNRYTGTRDKTKKKLNEFMNAASRVSFHNYLKR